MSHYRVINRFFWILTDRFFLERFIHSGGMVWFTYSVDPDLAFSHKKHQQFSILITITERLSWLHVLMDFFWTNLAWHQYMICPALGLVAKLISEVYCTITACSVISYILALSISFSNLSNYPDKHCRTYCSRINLQYMPCRITVFSLCIDYWAYTGLETGSRAP